VAIRLAIAAVDTSDGRFNQARASGIAAGRQLEERVACMSRTGPIGGARSRMGRTEVAGDGLPHQRAQLFVS
jgi:hypothetical protein